MIYYLVGSARASIIQSGLSRDDRTQEFPRERRFRHDKHNHRHPEHFVEWQYNFLEEAEIKRYPYLREERKEYECRHFRQFVSQDSLHTDVQPRNLRHQPGAVGGDQKRSLEGVAEVIVSVLLEYQSANQQRKHHAEVKVEVDQYGEWELFVLSL